MIYTDLIQLVGQYMTFDEFAKAHPEIELTQNDWYSILDGRTMRTQKKELKQRYLDEFDADWSNQPERNRFNHRPYRSQLMS